MKSQRPFRLLLKLFQDRFFGNDAGGFQTNIYQVLGFLAAAGLFVGYFLMPVFVQLSLRKPAPETDWALRSLRLFFPAYSFAVVGFATVFEWDMLFPDRRDFLILATFPIRLRELFAAKFAALVLFLLLLIAAVNLVPNLMVMVLSMVVPQLHGTGLRLAVAQIAATTCASAFAFFAVAAFQGLLINITSPKIFRRLSPFIQMFGMSLMVLAILTFPIYSMLLRPAAETHGLWLWFFPPVWFSGLYELLLAGRNELFVSLGSFALKMLGTAVVVLSLTWAFGFRRHYRRTLEMEDTSLQTRARKQSNCLIRSPQERAMFDFSGKTLARSQKHQLFLATYLGVGFSIGLLFALAVRAGKIVLSHDGLRSFPFLIAFFVISGFRAVFQFPAELASNWLFRMNEAHWTETSRSATRKRVLLSGLGPTLLFLLPFEIVAWEWRSGLLHGAFQFMTGALLIELMFWRFDKVPFTCSYFPGRTNLSILAALYLYGFTNYSFHLADLEGAIEGHSVRALFFFTAAAVLLTLSWLRHPAPSPVRFDAEEPVIQTLELT